jgi:hypothetical protein
MRTRVGSAIACPKEIKSRITFHISVFADISSGDVNVAGTFAKQPFLRHLSHIALKRHS